MIHDSKEAHESLRFVKALRIDLTAANVPAAQGGALVEAARTGIRHPEPPRKHPPISTSVPATAASTPPEEEFASAESEPPVHFAGIPEPPIRLATASGGPPPLRGTALRARPGTSEEDEEPHSSRWRAVIPMGLALLFVAAVGVGIAIWKWPQRGEVASSNEDKTEQTVVVINSPENLNPKHADAAGDLDKNDDQPNTGKAKIVAPPGQQVAEANITPSLSTNQDDTPHSKPDEKKKESESSSSQDPEPQKSFSESTTNTIAPKQPEIRRVELPTFETPATLFEFDLPPGQQLQPPKMWLLKPTWLPFLDETHRHETAVVERGTGDDRFATFTTQSKDNHHSYQLRALRDDNKIQWLAWYAVQLDGIPPIAPERFAIFMRLPLDAKTLDRNLGKGPIRWSLPADAIMNSVRIPNMKLDELSILIGQHTYSLSADMPAHDWRLPLAQYEEDTYKHCGVIPSSEPKMRVDLRLDPNEKYLELKCVGVELLQDYIDDALSSMWRVKKGVLSQINPLNDEIVADLGRQLAGINIRTEANAARGITDVKKIISRLNMLRDEVKGQNDNVNELNKAIETARQVETALEHSSQFHQSKKELKDAVITAARIHYDVTTKDKSKTLAIDVVNFEDASPAPTNQQEATP